MTLKDLVEKVQAAGLLIQNSGEDMAEVNVKFMVSDRSEGTEIDVDNVDQILYDILNPSKVTIHLS